MVQFTSEISKFIISYAANFALKVSSIILLLISNNIILTKRLEGLSQEKFLAEIEN